MVLNWTKSQAEAFLAEHAALFASAGLKPSIVGGVAKLGHSAHDLDVLLTPTRDAFDLEPIILHFGWDNVEEGGNPYQENSSIFELRLADGRIVDLITA